jgi:hypothetical protein
MASLELMTQNLMTADKNTQRKAKDRQLQTVDN